MPEVNIYASQQLTFGHGGGNFLVNLPRDVSYRAALGRQHRLRRQAPAERRRKGKLPFGLDAMVAEMHPPAARKGKDKSSSAGSTPAPAKRAAADDDENAGTADVELFENLFVEDSFPTLEDLAKPLSSTPW